MPIHCPISFPRLETDEFAQLDFKVMEQAFASQRALGRLADEKVFQADFAARLDAAGWAVQTEVPVTVSFRTFSKVYYLDLVVAAQAIYELKTVARLTSDHAAQLMNYLLMLDCSRGKLVNFRPYSVVSRFINTPLTSAQRHDFRVNSRDWHADGILRDWIVEMVQDWGTALELPLYHQAIVHLLGGDAIVTKQLPMARNDLALGNQRFHLLDSHHAFRLTAFNDSAPNYANDIKRLLNHSSLKAIHWINIAQQQVTFTTIR